MVARRRGDRPAQEHGWPGTLADAVWLRGDLAILRLCHGVVLLPSWPSSAGASGEHECALGRGLPCFYWPRDRALVTDFIRNFPAL